MPIQKMKAVYQPPSFREGDKVMVRMRGLPYDVSPENVIIFFADYNIIPDSIVIAEKPDGKRTGDGVVLFQHEDEAMRAVSE
jgi:epithelial splicing regulatory protein 1/2